MRSRKYCHALFPAVEGHNPGLAKDEAVLCSHALSHILSCTVTDYMHPVVHCYAFPFIYSDTLCTLTSSYEPAKGANSGVNPASPGTLL